MDAEKAAGDAAAFLAKMQNGRPKKGGVVIAWIHPGTVDGMFCDSVVGSFMHDTVLGHQRLSKWGGQISMRSSPRIAEARSQLVDRFLEAEHFLEAEWLWMVDADMTWRDDSLERLLEIADPVDAPIVGGLCFAGGSKGPGKGIEMYPTIYRLYRKDDGVHIEPVREYPRDSVVKVGGTGAAFLLVHRSVFLRMMQPHDKGGFGTYPDGRPNAYPWFAEGHVDHRGMPFGEDIAFCLRAQAMGIPVYVHTGISVGHVKTMVLEEYTFDRFSNDRPIDTEAAAEHTQPQETDDDVTTDDRAVRDGVGVSPGGHDGRR